jgi:hypothetical protein
VSLSSLAAAAHVALQHAPGTPGQKKAVPGPIDKRRYAQVCERHPDGRFKKRSQPPGAAVPDSATEPPKPTQPTRDLDNGSPPSNSNPGRSCRVRTEPGNCIHTSAVSPASGGRSASGGPGSRGVLIRNPQRNPSWKGKKKQLNLAPGMTPRRRGEGSPPPTFTVEGYNPCKYDTFYCSRCRTDNSPHSYRECPLWRECGFCDRLGHWGFDCPTPHTKCSKHRCGVHVGHPKIGKACPWSKERKNENFGYKTNGLERNLTKAREIYGVGLDWDSYRLPMWLTRAEGPQQQLEAQTSYGV